MKKRLWSAFFAVIVMMNISPMFVSADAGIDIRLAQVEAELGSDEIISVPVNADANAGYITGTIDFKWDNSALTLVSVDFTEIAPNCNSAAITDTGIYRVAFGKNLAEQDFTGTGKMFALNFKAKDTAKAGTYDINVVHYDIINYDLLRPSVTFNTGSVKLSNEVKSVSLAADNVSADLTAGSEVRVPVSAAKNSGYVAGLLDITWNKEALALKAVEYNADNAPERGAAPIANTGSYKVSFGNSTATSDFKGKGEFFTLVFTVTDTAAAGTYPIGLASPTIVNNALEKVYVTLKDGSVELKNTATATTTSTTTSAATTTKKLTTTTTTSTATTTKKPTTTTTSVTTTSVTTTVPTVTYTLGDVNNDGQINSVDASSVLLYYALISTNKEGGYDDKQKAAADVNHDGMINSVDASRILSYYAYASTTMEDVMSLEEFLKKK